MNLSSLKGCVLILGLFSLSGAEAAEWHKIGHHRGGFIYVDRQSIKESGKDTLSAWIKVEVRAEADHAARTRRPVAKAAALHGGYDSRFCMEICSTLSATPYSLPAH